MKQKFIKQIKNVLFIFLIIYSIYFLLTPLRIELLPCVIIFIYSFFILMMYNLIKSILIGKSK